MDTLVWAAPTRRRLLRFADPVAGGTCKETRHKIRPGGGPV